jgi:hypothetical protein
VPAAYQHSRWGHRRRLERPRCWSC